MSRILESTEKNFQTGFGYPRPEAFGVESWGLKRYDGIVQKKSHLGGI